MQTIQNCNGIALQNIRTFIWKKIKILDKVFFFCNCKIQKKKKEDSSSWQQFISAIRTDKDDNKINNIVEFRVEEVSCTFKSFQDKASHPSSCQ